MQPKKERPIDKLAQESYKWHQKAWTFITKKELIWWQTALVVAFFVGIFVAAVAIVRIRIETNSAASGNQASFSISPATFALTTGDTFSASVMLNTNGAGVVAQTAIVKYDPSVLQLVNNDESTSVFTKANNSSSGKTCLFNNTPCQLIQNDTTNGNISITEAAPTPGVSTTSSSLGNIVTLQFKALKAASSSLSLSFTAAGNYSDSNVIINDGKGTDILSSVGNATVTIKDPVVTCTGFTYSDWGTCANGTQTRTVATSTPSGCTGGSPSLSQSCTMPTCTSFTYSNWGNCTNGTQTRTVATSTPTGCTGGSPALSQSCSAPTCTGFTYSNWGTCTNGTQTRTVSSSTPSGCTGGSPSLSQSCMVATTTCTTFNYAPWGTCTNGSQSRTITTQRPNGCTGGTPVLTQACTPPTCTNFSYGPWGACQSNSTKTRTATGMNPKGCVGGSPVVSISCYYSGK